ATAVKTFADFVYAVKTRPRPLTPSQERIARFVMSESEACAFMSISELAEAAQVNEATVSRFCAALNLGGYSALVGLCQAKLREDMQLLGRFDSLSHRRSADEDIFAHVTANDQRNVARTLGRIELESWKRIVQVLASAQTAYVMGLRVCHSGSFLLAYLLSLVRERVVHVNPSAGLLPDTLRGIGKRDAFVAISIHPYSRETVSAARFATECEARTIVITDNAASPLVGPTVQALYFEAIGGSLMRSMTALISLVETLASEVALALGQDARDTLRSQQRALREFETYSEDSAGESAVFRLAKHKGRS
ncbi:MAG: MurR/RpiR family transcriptional regulator, partial [Vulcanimicrobiaceae bacterium]